MISFSHLARAAQLSIANVLVLMSSSAFAQESSSGEYKPPTGEQPTYGKRYTPGASEASYVIEINAAQLINKGVGLEFESKGSESMNFGADLLFTDKSVSLDGGATGSSQSLLIAPKIRLYPMQALSGVFLGGKVYLGQVNSSITVAGKSSDKSFNIIAPTVHVGYRFLSTFGFTWSLYGGAGVNFPRPKFENKHLSDQSQTTAAAEIISKVNEINRDVRVDLGFTLGVAL